MAQHYANAHPYAKALFALAKQDKALAEWSQILASLSYVAKDAKLLSLLKDPQVSRDKLSKALLDILAPIWQQSSQAKQAKLLLELLVEHQRFAIAPEIAVIYKKLREEQENVAEALATSAIELNEQQQAKLKTALEKRLDKKVLLQFATDKDIIGGVKIQIGDTVIDGSVATQLQNLRQAMVGGTN